MILHKFILMIDMNILYMREALKEARKALSEDEVPVGCVIVHNDKIIARAYNMCERLCDPTAHAEMQAITSACNYLESKYLNECTIYVTLEPCVMCGGALFWSKIGAIVYGARDSKQGMFKMEKNITHPKTKITGGILKEECAYLLSSFFEKKRKLDKKK